MNATLAHAERIDAERIDDEKIPHVPREPSEYRVTSHFVNRLKTRVDDAYQDSLPGRIIREGRIQKVESAHSRDRFQTVVALSTTDCRDRLWTILVGLRHSARIEDRELHRAITIYRGHPDDDSREAET